MKIKIAKDFQTKIASYELNTKCQCGGDMETSSIMHSSNGCRIVVDCDKCGRSSSLTISFNDYETLEEEI